MTTSAYPLSWPTGWPRCTQRKRAKFGTMSVQRGRGRLELTVAESVRRIRVELKTFGIKDDDSIISTNIALRLDGLPRSDQRAPADPGAAVYWRKQGESMKVMAIDIYDRVEDNLAAIAATLNAMRAIERHGGARILERAFTGFNALPPPGASRPWRQVLGLHGVPTVEAIESRYRTLARQHHPDVAGPDSTGAMAELNAARDAALKEISQ